jgi:N-sulfoglucosamine sulfohydrolase
MQNGRMTSRPNIVLITGHDFGRQLGCYGRAGAVSPRLDRFAAEGVRFDNAFATAPTCSPSRAALHTGCYPHSVGMMGFPYDAQGFQLTTNKVHLAGQLRQVGYRTALVGFQHVVTPGREPELGFDDAWPDDVKDGVAVAGTAVEFLRRQDRERPFYLELGFFQAHTDWSTYPETGWAGEERSRGVGIPGYLPKTPAVESYLAAFQFGVRQLDEYVGTVLDALEQNGLAETTWVIVAADHGMPVTRAKGTLYDAGIEVTLLMRCPSLGLVGGRHVDALVSNVDVVPTILEAVGAEAPDGIQGRSLLPLLAGETARVRTEVYAEQTFCDDYAPMRCIRTDTHKLIYNVEAGYSITYDQDARLNSGHHDIQMRYRYLRPHFELYDLAADPDEQRDVYGHDSAREIAADLRRRLRDWMEDTGDPLLDGPVPSPFYHRGRRELLS